MWTGCGDGSVLSVALTSTFLAGDSSTACASTHPVSAYRFAFFPWCGNRRQLGATLVMDKGGAMLLDFRQETAADHVAAETLLRLFGLEGARLEGEDNNGRAAACADEQCK